MKTSLKTAYHSKKEETFRRKKLIISGWYQKVTLIQKYPVNYIIPLASGGDHSGVFRPMSVRVGRDKAIIENFYNVTKRVTVFYDTIVRIILLQESNQTFGEQNYPNFPVTSQRNERKASRAHQKW